MDVSINIIFPLPVAVFAVFITILAVATVYYGIKFVITLFIGG